MSKFLLKKKFSLSFLGKEWKEKGAYIVFNAFTVRDIKEKLPKLISIDEDDAKSIESGIAAMLELLQDKFISGSGVNEKGEKVAIEAQDLEELPVEVISKAIDFLSQGLAGETPKP